MSSISLYIDHMGAAYRGKQARVSKERSYKSDKVWGNGILT